ncbi:MAG: peptidoglycan DD-metalloendopeptidase family protein [Monoglobaceae bacterium]
MKRRILSVFMALLMVAVLGSFTINASAASQAYSTSVTTDSYYTISNLGSGKMLNVYGSKNANNTNVTVYKYDRTSGQSFKFVKSGSNYVIIPKCATSRALNVYGTSAQNNSNVCIWSKSGHSTQSWVIEYNSKLSGFVIKSANNTNYVLTATGSANSSNVCLKKYDANNKYQIWNSNALKATLIRQTSNNSNANSTSNSSWLWPCKTKSMSCDFGDTVYHKSWTHRGIDIRANFEDVYASKSGTVYQMGYNSSRGYWLVIDHGDGYYSAYQHLNKYYVKSGTYVSQGTVIAQSGNSGQGTGAHLHFEIMKLGKSGLANSYSSYFSQYSKYVNTNPKAATKAGFKLNNGTYVSTFSDSKGINYIYK